MTKNRVICFILIILTSLCMFSVVNADVPKTRLKSIYINNFDIPKVGDYLDKSVTIDKTQGVTVSDIAWYKNDERYFDNVINEPGIYTCRIYLDVSSEYYADISTAIILNNGSYDKNVEIQYTEMSGNPLIFIRINVKNATIKYPTYISFYGDTTPTPGKVPKYSITSRHPDYYNVTKVEWYRENTLMKETDQFIGGIYKCKLYLELLQGFDPKKITSVTVGDSISKLIIDHQGVYVEAVYNVIPLDDEKMVKEFGIFPIVIPSYGLEHTQVKIEKNPKNQYYDIKRIEWYRNGSKMLESRFMPTTYQCKIFFEFINGGYPSLDIVGRIYDSSNRKIKVYQQAGEYYVEIPYEIKEPIISLFRFSDLNVPIYGNIQDARIRSEEPGMYTPSTVYWYKDGVYMSNVDKYQEGEYTCKFTINVNSECKVRDSFKVNINGELANNVRLENNVITVEKQYVVGKANKMWVNNSAWSEKELNEALENGLIPFIIANKDFRANITREEFAEITLKMYEQLSYKVVEPSLDNPFIDTTNSEIIKAYKVGITKGISENEFAPNRLITRQEMTTMMTRAISLAGIDTSVSSSTQKFEDHNDISDWAVDGVYFMSANKIIEGIGNNIFNVYGNATIEQAIAVSIRTIKAFN